MAGQETVCYSGSSDLVSPWDGSTFHSCPLASLFLALHQRAAGHALAHLHTLPGNLEDGMRSGGIPQGWQGRQGELKPAVSKSVQVLGVCGTGQLSCISTAQDGASRVDGKGPLCSKIVLFVKFTHPQRVS